MTLVAEQVASTGTAAGAVEDYLPARSVTESLSVRANYLRTDTDLLGSDVTDLHEEVRDLDLNTRASEKAKKSTPNLLNELAYDRAMGWSHIAEVLGVSVSAIRKWRQGGDASPENRAALARFAAFLDVLVDDGAIEDPATWMQMNLPLGPGYRIRPIDLYLTNHANAILELTRPLASPEHVLDHTVEGWREEQSALDVYVDDDGLPSIRVRT